jgi:hypothetical protein
MLLEIAKSSEIFATVLADERFDASVYVAVPPQIRYLNRGFIIFRSTYLSE